MTNEELKIYNKVRFELLMQDAEWRTKDYLEMMEIDIPIEDFNFKDMAKQFEKQMTADNSESFMWTQIIEEWISDIEWEESEPYCPSATAHDYGPSNPWDAPGMSVRDFI